MSVEVATLFPTLVCTSIFFTQTCEETPDDNLII